MTALKLHRFNENRSLSQANEIFEQRLKDAEYIFDNFSEEFIERACPCCGGKDYVTNDDFHGNYKVRVCRQCRTQYISPAPSARAIQHYYSHGECNRMLTNITANRASSFNVDDRVEEIITRLENRDKEHFRILEVGCSSGRFLSGLQKALKDRFPNKKFTLVGIDLDEEAINRAENPEIQFHCLSAEQFVETALQQSIQFDVIVHFELIEHLLDPIEFVTKLKSLLCKGGYMIFTTPNALGLDNLASDYNTRRLIAHAVFPPMHLNAFSTQNISVLAFKSGFYLCSITTPGKLDVDMVIKNLEFLTDRRFEWLADIDDESILANIQSLLVLCNASSHMQVVFQS